MPFDVWSSIGWRTPVAWLVALACIALAQRRFSALGALRPPATPTLIGDLLAEPVSNAPISDDVRALAIAEHNLRIGEVSFELGLLPATFTTLIRISLATGSALALLGLIDIARAPFEVAVRAAACAVSGLVGAGVVAAIGRSAKDRAREIRAEWDRSSREVGKELGTTLAEAGGTGRPGDLAAGRRGRAE